MEKTNTSSIMKLVKWYIGIFILPGVILIVVFTANYCRSLPEQQRIQQEARKRGYSKADKLAIYSAIGFLEERTRKSIIDLIVMTNGSTNANATFVKLLEKNNMSPPCDISNHNGIKMLVDPWGTPYQLTILTNAERSRELGHKVQKSIIIEQVKNTGK